MWKLFVDLKNTCFQVGIGKYLAQETLHVFSFFPSAKFHQGTSSSQHQKNILHDTCHFVQMGITQVSCLTLTHSPQVQTTILKSTAKGEFLVTCILTIGTGVYCGQYNTGFCRGSLPPCRAHPTVISCSKWVALKLPGTFCPQLGKVQVSQLPYEGFQLHYSWQENILLWLLQDGLNILLPLTKAGRQLQRIGQISSQGVLKPGLSGN